MIIATCNKNYSHCTLNFFIDHDKKTVDFVVTISIYGDTYFDLQRYKTYHFKTLKAAYNKYDYLINKYNLAF